MSSASQGFELHSHAASKEQYLPISADLEDFSEEAAREPQFPVCRANYLRAQSN